MIGNENLQMMMLFANLFLLSDFQFILVKMIFLISHDSPLILVNFCFFMSILTWTSQRLSSKQVQNNNYCHQNEKKTSSHHEIADLEAVVLSKRVVPLVARSVLCEVKAGDVWALLDQDAREQVLRDKRHGQRLRPREEVILELLDHGV